MITQWYSSRTLLTDGARHSEHGGSAAMSLLGLDQRQ